MEQKILYVAPILPKRSETFVYREILGLRELGLKILTASLYTPESDLGSPATDQLAKETITIFTNGWEALLRHALLFEITHPIQAWLTYGLTLRDILLASDLTPFKRFKLYPQCLAALALAWRLRQSAPTHIHAHFAHSSATIAMYAANALRIPFSFTGHAADLFRKRSLLKEKLIRAKFVVAISHWHQSFYQNIHNRPESDYPIIRCGVDVPSNPPKPRTTQERFQILAIGRLIPKKGFDVLLKAAKALSEKNFPLSIRIAGNGPELPYLQQLAQGLSVEFLGAVNHSTIPQLLANCDLFVLPCKIANDGDRDGIPVALMEAMAAGVCVIAGNLPTITELVEDKVSGWLVPPDDPTSLANSILHLAQNEDLRNQLAINGWRKVLAQFSSATNLANLKARFLQSTPNELSPVQ
ncbi:MAG: glycosyltransferase family 4 protein [Chthoniobacterales bacterium]|nr:glycosyltransferase family 4 protein [Chthoniobacterales bacterium]